VNTVPTLSRQRLSNRRASTNFNFECNGLTYCGTISRYPDGRLAEIFINNSRAGSHSDSAAKDSANSTPHPMGLPLNRPWPVEFWGAA
jgi:hypothetical protein